MAVDAAVLCFSPTEDRRATAAAVDTAEFDEAFWPLFLLGFKAAYRILRDRHAAEDVAAETLGRLHLDWRRLGRATHREAWVVRAATNRALDVVRRRPPPVIERPPTGFEEQVASRLLVAAVLRELSSRQREVITLRYLVGLSEDDVASVLGIGTGSVRRHVARGLERLRRRLAP